MTLEELVAKANGTDLTPAMRRRMEKDWGTRCAEHNSDCPACVAWELFEAAGDRPSVKEVVQHMASTRERS